MTPASVRKTVDLDQDQYGATARMGKRQANPASQVAINYENVRPLTGKLMGAHNDGYGSRWT